MIPVSDVIPCRTRPWAALALIVSTVGVFVWQQTLSASEAAHFVHRFGVVPTGLSAGAAVTSLFVHAGWLQLGTSLLPLWVLGPTVEDRLGHARFLLLYLLAGCSAVWMAGLTSPGWAGPIVGATGAAAGVAGAYLLAFPRSKVLLLVPARSGIDAAEIPATFVVLIWFLFVTLSTTGSATAATMAASGFVVGAAAGWLLRRRDRDRVSWWSP